MRTTVAQYASISAALLASSFGVEESTWSLFLTPDSANDIMTATATQVFYIAFTLNLAKLDDGSSRQQESSQILWQCSDCS